MERRQTQITEGAGLEESRLNTDFIDFMKRWSSPVLMLLAVLALGYWGYGKLQQAKKTKIDQAFGELQAAGYSGNPSPDALRRVAEDFAGVASISHLARLRAADVYLAAVRRGLRVGVTTADLNLDGSAKNEEDLLSDEDRARYLDEAESLYARVLDDVGGHVGRELLEMDALYGLAAVAEAKGDWDQARARYERIAELADRDGFEPHGAIARQRIASLDELKVEPKLYAKADLPAPPTPETTPLPQPDDPNPGDVLLDPGDTTQGLFPTAPASPIGAPASPTPADGPAPVPADASPSAPDDAPPPAPDDGSAPEPDDGGG